MSAQYQNKEEFMPNFILTSDYQPTGDQPEAIAQLTEGIRQGLPAQTLLGVTGSGKTFTIANVIRNANKPLSITYPIMITISLKPIFRQPILTLKKI